MKAVIFRIFAAGILAICISACNNAPKPPAGAAGKTQDTLSIWADSSLRVLMNEHKKAFENIYNTPALSIQYMDEARIVRGLMDNKVNCAILHRNLLENESAYLKSREDFTPKQYTFAYDAFVCVSNKQNAGTVMSLDMLDQYFAGRETNFLLAVENTHCQSIQFMRTRFGLNREQLSRIYAKSSLNELMEHLRANPKAVGIIPFSYISDIEASSTIKLLEGLKVMPVSYRDSSQKMRTIEPSQSSITTREYPLVSPIVLVNGNMGKKSGTNFVNYIFKPKAQRLILKFGLCPAIFPGREVNINTN